MYPELYRRSNEYIKGNNADIAEPYRIGKRDQFWFLRVMCYILLTTSTSFVYEYRKRKSADTCFNRRNLRERMFRRIFCLSPIEVYCKFRDIVTFVDEESFWILFEYFTKELLQLTVVSFKHIDSCICLYIVLYLLLVRSSIDYYYFCVLLWVQNSRWDTILT